MYQWPCDRNSMHNTCWGIRNTCSSIQFYHMLHIYWFALTFFGIPAMSLCALWKHPICVSSGLQQLWLRQVSEGMLPKWVSSGLDREARTLKRSCSPPTVSDEIISQAKNHMTCSVVDLGVHIMIASFSLAVCQDLYNPHSVPHRTRRGALCT